MIRSLLLVGTAIFRVALISGLSLAFSAFAPESTFAAPFDASIAPTGMEQIDIYDVDAMAARMSSDKEYYQKLRDEALALYSSRHPAASPYDDQAREVIRLAAYYMTWGDLYGEGVLRDIVRFEKVAEHKGCLDPMLLDLYTCAWDDNHYPDSDARAVEISNEMILAVQGQSPAAFKLWGTQTAILAVFKHNLYVQNSQHPASSMQMLPQVVSFWKQALAQVIKDKAPAYTIYGMASQVLDFCKSDESTQNLVIAAIDQAYNETGTDNGLRWALDGDYFIDAAWAARGAGYANTVSSQQSLAFEQRLIQAKQILEAGYAKYPDEPKISNLMLAVALGGSLDRNTMEMWFQRALKADPSNFNAYASKEWYLQPRWYGTADDEWKFVQECAATQNWSSNIPMVLAIGLDNLSANGAQDIFTHDDVWKLTESVYRKYLEIYPRSVRYRTYFLKAAYRGHHQEVVQEQYKILGASWDDVVISRAEYNIITASLLPANGSRHPDMDQALSLLQKAESMESGPSVGNPQVSVLLQSALTIIQNGGAKAEYHNHRFHALNALQSAIAGLQKQDAAQTIDNNIKKAILEIHRALQAAADDEPAAISSP